MCSDKVPDGSFTTSGLCESFFKTAVWLICRDYEVLLYRGCSCNRLEATLLLVERRDVRNNEASLLESRLNSIPDRSLGIGKLDGHPPARLQYSVCLPKALRHKISIFIKSFAVRAILNCFVFRVRRHAEPTFPKKVQLRV